MATSANAGERVEQPEDLEGSRIVGHKPMRCRSATPSPSRSLKDRLSTKFSVQISRIATERRQSRSDACRWQSVAGVLTETASAVLIQLVRLAYYIVATEVTMSRFATTSPTEVAPLRLLTLRLARRLRKHAGTGLSPSQQSALTTLERRGPMRVGELARREQISKSSVTRLVARLEELALVERRPDESDGRSWWVELTDRGSELLASSSQRADAYLARQVAILAPDDQRRLRDALPVLERLLDVKA